MGVKGKTASLDARGFLLFYIFFFKFNLELTLFRFDLFFFTPED